MDTTIMINPQITEDFLSVFQTHLDTFKGSVIDSYEMKSGEAENILFCKIFFQALDKRQLTVNFAIKLEGTNHCDYIATSRKEDDFLKFINERKEARVKRYANELRGLAVLRKMHKKGKYKIREVWQRGDYNDHSLEGDLFTIFNDHTKKQEQTMTFVLPIEVKSSYPAQQTHIAKNPKLPSILITPAKTDQQIEDSFALMLKYWEAYRSLHFSDKAVRTIREMIKDSSALIATVESTINQIELKFHL